MLKINTQEITLENVKKSSYWDLISYIVWSHYSEERFQDDSKITITERFYGKRSSGGSYGAVWQNPNYTQAECVRTLNAIEIQFERSDYTTYISLYVEDKAPIISARAYYNEGHEKKHKEVNLTNSNYLKVCNWMLKHKFYIYQP